MVGWPGYRSKALRALVITRADALEITEALRAAFPSLRITYSSFLHKFSDMEDYWRRGPVPGFSMRDPRGEPFPYLDSFAVADPTEFSAWIEPPGWVPQWSREPDERGIYLLLNEPKLQFRLGRGTFHVQSRREPDAQYLFIDPPEPRSEEELIVLDGRSVWTRWPKEDKEIPSFFNKVLRIIARVTTNSFVSIGNDYKARSEAFDGPEYYYRAGKDACAWALKRRHNYFQDMWKPGNYPYMPDQVYSEAELRAEKEASKAALAQKDGRSGREVRQPGARQGSEAILTCGVLGLAYDGPIPPADLVASRWGLGAHRRLTSAADAEMLEAKVARVRASLALLRSLCGAPTHAGGLRRLARTMLQYRNAASESLAQQGR